MSALSQTEVRISRRISLVLRHRPAVAGLTLDAQGWVPVTDLLAGLGITRDQLDIVVAGNDKTRFAIATGPDGIERIRASQGHSRRVEVDLGLPPARPPAVLFHGTPAANLTSIRADGLRSLSRHHVHLSTDVATALRVGRRRSAEVAVLRVAAGAMADSGHVFHVSDNSVWLTASMPPEFLTPEPTNP